MSLWEGSQYDHAQAENARLLQAHYEGMRKARILAHQYKQPEVARSIHGNCLAQAEIYAERGNVCMAHAKRLQAKYWARRAFGPWDQPMEYGAPYRLRTDALRAAEIVAVSAFSP